MLFSKIRLKGKNLKNSSLLRESGTPPAGHMTSEKRDISVTEESKHYLGHHSAGTQFTQYNQLGLLIRGKWHKPQQDLPYRRMECPGNMARAELKPGADINNRGSLTRLHPIDQFPYLHMIPMYGRLKVRRLKEAPTPFSLQPSA